MFKEWKDTDVAIGISGFNGDIATYTITINPERRIINNGNPLTLKASFSNGKTAPYAAQSIDYSSIAIMTDGTVDEPTYDYSDNTGTYLIPDGCFVTITYNTRVVGDVGKEV